MIFAEVGPNGHVVNLVMAESGERIPPVGGSQFVPAHANVCVGTRYDFDTGEFIGVSAPEPLTVDDTSLEYPEENSSEIAEPDAAKRVSPIEFKLLWTSAERVAIKDMRPSDPIVDDFLEIIDDPRLTFVNLSLESTQQGIDYILSKLVAAEVVVEEDAPLRREAILSAKFR